MQFKAFEPDIEVNAPTVSAIIAGLGFFNNISRRYLSQAGIGRVVDKKLVLQPEHWYSQEAWLLAFENIARQIGDRALFNIGMTIPSNAHFPPWAVDIQSGVRSIDIAYHLNHRKNGLPMFNAETQVMLEGIGHYGCQPVSGQNEILCVCNNPYPCAFDRGIISAMAKKFEPEALIVHDDAKECRKNGADSCTYRVYW
ncbi:MAG: hypothetical protein LBP22_14920 [Deltaproteobacteria bacterium]|nr:hypothetical protein [Deltaproteobacteria bacterium]